MNVSVAVDPGRVRIDTYHDNALQEAVAKILSQSDVMMDCTHCDGSGQVECSGCVGHGGEDCPDCLGDGCDECEWSGEVDCADCSGGGWTDCEYCDGQGERPVQWASVTVEIVRAGADVEGAE